MQRLQDRCAVVTGAASGIGLAAARRLAAEGAHVVAVDLDEEAGKVAADEIGGLFVRADVTCEDDVRQMYEVAVGRYGSVDIAFNNAGISPPDDDSILSTGLDTWRRVQEVNLTSVYLCCKYAIPQMQRRGKGSVINTASFVAVPGAGEPATAARPVRRRPGTRRAPAGSCPDGPVRRTRGNRGRGGVPGQ